MIRGGPFAPDAGLLGPQVTRRDFCNAALVGAGAALLTGCGSRSGEAGPAPSGPGAAWDGPSGLGEYRGSNGNTWRTMEAGHRIRDGAHADTTTIADPGERYDLIVVGGGFTGLGAMHAFRKQHPNGTCLLLDNQEIFGGYAKANEFEIDGYRLAGAQASLNFVLPRTPEDRGAEIWNDLGLPREFAFAEREDGNHAITFAASTSAPLYYGEQSASVGYFFGERGWAKDIWQDELRRAPFSDETKQALMMMRARKRAGAPSPEESARLDAMTFAEFATRELKATPEALAYITQGMCITGPQISAYGARSFPGLERYVAGSAEAELGERFISFPSGNTVLARALVRAALPDAFSGKASPSETFGRIVPSVLDKPGSPCRIRSRATAVKVTNLPGGRVEVIYEHDGQLRKGVAGGVVLGIGAWVAKHIISDLPAGHRAAFDRYLYSPMLMVNVALRNWRFLDKLGISAARWFDGTGFYCNIRKPMLFGDGPPAPFHPDKPILMTMYAAFPRADLPLEAQGPDARGELFATPYADYEKRIVQQLEAMFAPAGFDAQRDVAGIVLNRWGHAFVTPPPGFYFAGAGEIAAADLPKHPVGRIAWAPGADWVGSAMAGRVAVEQLMGQAS
jgi:spermidine dehydrogenase